MSLAKRAVAAFAVSLLLLSGCASKKVESYAGSGPRLVLEEHFAGPVTA